ncbi:MAG: hypothetical protein HGB12_12435 [Bacteroidetes bacterium]|nr:hypothetical protein [Bacteroidota bacterium]
MKRNQVDGFLRNKMAFTMKENKRHTDYMPIFSGNVIALPRLLRLTRSSKEVPINNIDGIARVLNYTHRELAESIKCTISASTGYYSMSVAMLLFVEQKNAICPNFSDEFYPSLQETINLLLNVAENQWRKNKATKNDYLKLQGLSNQLLIIKAKKKKYAEISQKINNSIKSVLELSSNENT